MFLQCKIWIRVLGILMFVLANSWSMMGEEYTLLSPDRKLKVQFIRTDEGSFEYKFLMENKLIIDSSPIGYKMNNGNKIPGNDWVISNHSKRSFKSVWKPVWGKRSLVPDVFNELTLELAPRMKNGTTKLLFVVRLYNDGLAFRYEFPEKQEGLQSELTGFCFAGDYTAWSYNGENANIGPEKLSNIDGTRRPVVLLNVDPECYVAIHEADLRAGNPLRLTSQKENLSFMVEPSPVTLSEENCSSWRVVMAGDKLGTLVDSHVVELLNPEPQMDFSWVKPGVYVWDWRINGAIAGDFTYTMTYPSWVRMVDFASRQGFGGLVLDANWYGPEHESESDPMKGGQAQDVRKIIQYAKNRGVGIWLYLNDVGGRNYPIEETLKLYHGWGAVGVKYGFMKGTEQEKNVRTRMITELCAENRLLVDFHDGPIHPYGQMRTWPNAITREYCHAQLDAHRVFIPSTFVTSVFVNMLAGPIDMNNGMFDLRQGATTRVDENQPVPSTVVSEAARTLVTFSGATILPDIPEFYEKYPELLSFISAQQMPWKESKTLDGKVGEYIIMMRQTDDAYLVAAVTNEKERELEIPLSFLPAGKFDLTLMQDGIDAHYLKNRESYRVSTHTVKNGDRIKVRLAAGGGACLLLRKKLPECLSLRSGLYWTNKKIQKKEPLKIAFLGGSITQAPGYRVQFEEWFKQSYPEVPLSTINAGIGGTGSDLGVARVDEKVLSENPDLVFVEFAVNDAQTDSLQIVRSMEGIVRKIQKHSKQVDICFLYTTNTPQKSTIMGGEHWRSARIMEQVARYYGIPSVSFDYAVARLLREDKLVMHALKDMDYGKRIRFTEDGTHPGDAGHAIYTETLCKAFPNMIKKGRVMAPKSLPLCDTNYEAANMYDVKEAWLSSGWEKKENSDPYVRPFREYFSYVASTNKSGEKIHFRFRGTRLGLFDIMGLRGAHLKVLVDGKNVKETRRFDKYCTYNRMSYFWLPELPEGEHTVEIVADCKPFDKMEILQTDKKIDMGELNKQEVAIGKILCVGEILD